MPFVTKYGGLTTDFDVVPTVRDKEGIIIQKGNGLKSLKLAFGSTCDFNPRSPEFQETVMRGTPNQKQRHWLDTPVYRVPLNRMSEEDQNRVVDFFFQNQNEETRLIYYEPAIEDIEIKTMGTKSGWHLPVLILKRLKSAGVFEAALKESKVELADEKKLTEEEYEILMQAYDQRMKLGDISEKGLSKPSTNKKDDLNKLVLKT